MSESFSLIELRKNLFKHTEFEYNTTVKCGNQSDGHLEVSGLNWSNDNKVGLK